MNSNQFRIFQKTKLFFSLFFIFLLFTIHHSLSAASIRDRVVAFIDNTAITLSEFEEEYAKAKNVTLGITKEEVLNAMINRVLLLREAKKIRLEERSDDELLKEYIDLKLRTFIKIKEKDVSDYYEIHSKDFQGKILEEVREEIETYLAEVELNRLLRKHIEELRKKAFIGLQLE